MKELFWELQTHFNKTKVFLGYDVSVNYLIDCLLKAFCQNVEGVRICVHFASSRVHSWACSDTCRGHISYTQKSIGKQTGIFLSR